MAELKRSADTAESAAQRKDDIDAALKEHGIGQQPEGDAAQAAQLASLNDRGNDIEAAVLQMADLAGVSSDDLNWEGGRNALLAGRSNTEIIAAYGQAIKNMADAGESDPAGDRRDERKDAAGTSPSGSSPAEEKDPLTTGTLDDQVAALRSIGALKG
jgi:hypothetical protein